MLYRVRGDEARVFTAPDGVIYTLDPAHTYDDTNPADVDAIEAGARFLDALNGPESATKAPGEKRSTRRG